MLYHYYIIVGGRGTEARALPVRQVPCCLITPHHLTIKKNHPKGDRGGKPRIFTISFSVGSFTDTDFWGKGPLRHVAHPLLGWGVVFQAQWLSDCEGRRHLVLSGDAFGCPWRRKCWQ